MATPLTYTWFYERVRNGGTWDYKQQKRAYADFGKFSITALWVMQRASLKRFLLIAAGAAQLEGPAHQGRNGAILRGPRRLVMIRWTNFG